MKKECGNKMIDNIKGTYLSNFYNCEVRYDGLTYHSAEAAFQAAKCANERERKMFTVINGAQAKSLGKKIKMREDWDKVKTIYMMEIVASKFQQHPVLFKMLKATGDEEIQEGNTWNDKFWGVCDGEGLNWMGRILMTIRKGEIK